MRDPVLDEARAFHRAMRQSYHKDDPWFQRGLRELVEVHEYSDDDIGMMLGVSRERVRQWRVYMNLNKKRIGSGWRRFDWAKQRFCALSSYERQRFMSSVRAGKHRIAVQRKRERVCAWMWAFASRYGRSPSLGEIADDMGFDCPEHLYMWLGYRPGRNRAADCTAALYEDAGLPKRARGGRGHVAKRRPRTTVA